MFVIRTGIHKILVIIINREDLDQILIWVYSVCLCPFVRQLVFEILENELYLIVSEDFGFSQCSTNILFVII